MEVFLSSELHGKLDRMAAQRGCESRTLVVEAVERMIDYDQWFMSQVEKGLAAADSGKFVEHETVAELIRDRYAS